MNAPDDLTPKLRAWLQEPVSLPEDGITAVGREVHLSPQQQGPLPPLRIILGTRWFAFAGGATAATLVIVLAGLALLAVIGRPDTVPVPGVVAGSPSPSAAPPDWPGVTFEPVAAACVDGCDWASGGVWSVEAEHHGDIGSIEAIVFGPDGRPWFAGDGTIWQLGRSGAHRIPGSPVGDLAVADDGTLWFAGEAGLHSFDGTTWAEPWSDAALDRIDIAPDGTVVAVGRGRAGGAEAYPVVTRHPDGTVSIDSVDALPEGKFPTDLALADDGRLWVGAIDSGYWPIAIGESLIAYSDGEGWTADRWLGPDVSVAAGGFARDPDGALWATISALPNDGEWATHLARLDGRGWSLVETEDLTVPYWMGPVIGPDGVFWFPGMDVAPNVSGGVVAYDGTTAERWLARETIASLGVGPDGTALVATLPGFDEEGQLFAIRR